MDRKSILAIVFTLSVFLTILLMNVVKSAQMPNFTLQMPNFTLGNVALFSDGHVGEIISLPTGHKFHSLVFAGSACVPFIVTHAPDGSYHATGNNKTYVIKEQLGETP